MGKESVKEGRMGGGGGGVGGSRGDGGGEGRPCLHDISRPLTARDLVPTHAHSLTAPTPGTHPRPLPEHTYPWQHCYAHTRNPTTPKLTVNSIIFFSKFTPHSLTLEVYHDSCAVLSLLMATTHPHPTQSTPTLHSYPTHGSCSFTNIKFFRFDMSVFSFIHQ